MQNAASAAAGPAPKASFRRNRLLAVMAMLAAGLWLAGPVAAEEIAAADAEIVAAVIAAIPDYDMMSPMEKAQALRQYAYRRTLVSEQARLILAPESEPLASLFARFDSNGEGVWCSGAAVVLARLYRHAGFRAFTYNYGRAESGITHVTTLVEVDGDLYVQDAYFNAEYVEADGTPIAFRNILEGLAAGAAPLLRQGVATRRSRVGALVARRALSDPSYAPFTVCEEADSGYVCAHVMTFGNFSARYYLRDRVNAWLQARGHEPDWSYLMLYPISVWTPDEAQHGAAGRLRQEIKSVIRGETPNWPEDALAADIVHRAPLGDAQVVVEPASIEMKFGKLAVETHPQGGGYSAMLDIADLPAERGEARVWVDVVDGSVAVTLTRGDDLDDWIADACVGPGVISDGPAMVRLSVDDMSEVGKVLIRNCSPFGASRAEVLSILFRSTETEA